MTERDRPPDDRPVDAPRAGRLGWRWLAPLLSVLVLSVLVGRVTNCAERTEAASPLRVTREPRDDTAAEEKVVPLRGTKSFGVESPGEKVQEAPEPLGADVDHLGGSKSGFGGLGLRGSGRMPAPSQAPSPPPSQAAP